ncbi:hypothetical protein [Halosegnis marinus]|uniref:DUF7973 domain-containing protein n=1 Tax=Halosegnis marinus TaxID=3034023 RepID=A0ABD5ZL67_9EURY|nr:hypothetical protein [Halosegnis sp. DT85]
MPTAALADALALAVVAFAGGAFGAALGALPSFTFCGFLVVAGETYKLAGRNIADGAVESVGFVDALAFGPLFGPHVAFGGGAAAAAYLATRDEMPVEGFAYAPAKRVTTGLGTRPDALAVGGAFGVLGHLVATGSAALSLPYDPVAMGVVVSALAHRAVFGYALVGARDGLFDMNRPGAEPWLPYMTRWPNVVAVGLAGGALGGYVAHRTGSVFLAFGLSVAILVFVNAGVARIPVTHHITLPASTAVLAAIPGPLSSLSPADIAATMPLWEAVALGAVFGLLGAVFGELSQRVLYAHADTHLDPPAASIVVTSFVVAMLALAGVLPGSVWVPVP